MKPTMIPELKHDHLLGVVKGLKAELSGTKKALADVVTMLAEAQKEVEWLREGLRLAKNWLDQEHLRKEQGVHMALIAIEGAAQNSNTVDTGR